MLPPLYLTYICWPALMSQYHLLYRRDVSSSMVLQPEMNAEVDGGFSHFPLSPPGLEWFVGLLVLIWVYILVPFCVESGWR